MGSEPKGGKILRTRTMLLLPTFHFKWGVNGWGVGKAGLTLEFVGVQGGEVDAVGLHDGLDLT
jgi:hypothetical protein